MDGFFFSKMFWGLLIVLFGCSLIFNTIFKTDIPFFKILISLFIIFLGFKMLFGSFGWANKTRTEQSSIFGDARVEPDKLVNNSEFNSIFGNQVIDLSQAEIEGDEVSIEANAVFGASKIILPANAGLKLKSSSVFGSVKGPDGSEVNFGSDEIVKKGQFSKTINIEANAVFGSVEID